MKKRLALLGLALMFVVGSLLGGAFAPFLRDKVSRAATVHDANVANYSIEHLPKKNFNVGEAVPPELPVANVPFTLTYLSSGNHYLIGVSEAQANGIDSVGIIGDGALTFDYAGTYTYSFYKQSEYDELDFIVKGSTTTRMLEGGQSFYTHDVSVASTSFDMKLPENSSDFMPNVVVPGTQITLPLPEHLYDTKGRDLLGPEDDEDANDAREAAYGVYGTFTYAQIIDMIYEDITLTIFTDSKDIKGGLGVDSIKHQENRRFTPNSPSKKSDAEYFYENRNTHVTASLFTDSVMVEKPFYPLGVDNSNAKNNILLVNNDIDNFTFSFVPSVTASQGTEISLPQVKVNVDSESDVKFDFSNTLTNFTYVAVSYRPNDAGEQWRWIDVNGGIIENLNIAKTDDSIMRITDFKFTPEYIGDYQFYYYTTTIFGAGKTSHLSAQQISDRILNFAAGEYTGMTFVSNKLPGNMAVTRRNEAPEIRWTAPFTLGSEPEFDDYDAAPDYSKWLPSTKSDTKTKILKGSELVIPALLGYDAVTPSDELDYEMRLYRYEDGVRLSDMSDCIIWNSGIGYSSIWDHSDEFRIEFSTDELEAGGKLAAWKYKIPNICTKYNLTVHAYNKNSVTGGRNVMSAQFSYYFTVVEDAPAATRPSVNGTFRAGQNEYHDGDTMRFDVASFSDASTEERDIEVRYYISIDNGLDIERLLQNIAGAKAHEIKVGDDGVTISGDKVSVELSDENDAGAFILGALDANPTGDGHLTFRVYAVARNYHAITNEIFVGEAGYLIANVIPTAAVRANYITAVYDTITIYDMTYGAAAIITDKFSESGNNAAYNNATRAISGGVSSWYGDGDTLRVDDGEKGIAIPALRFFYPNPDDDAEGLYSTVSYSVNYLTPNGEKCAVDSYAYNTQGILAAKGGVWGPDMIGAIQGDASVILPTLGAAANAYGHTIGDDTDVSELTNGIDDQFAAGQRFFKPLGAGEHYVTVTVTNAGKGNVSIFVGMIMITGVPGYSPPKLTGVPATVRVGQNVSLPKIQVRINDQDFVTGPVGSQNFLVTKDISDKVPGDRQARVGTIHISGSGVSNNMFNPQTAGTYQIHYTITVDDNQEGGTKILGMIEGPSDYLTIEETWTIEVEKFQESDMSIMLHEAQYRALAGQMPIGDADVNNFFTEMLSNSDELKMTRAQLNGGLEPFIPVDELENDEYFPTEWQYGKIYLPNYSAKLADGIEMDDFTARTAETGYVKVTKGIDGDTLLDTSDAEFDGQQDYFGVDPFGYLWFRPVGKLKAEYNDDAPGTKDLAWAIANAKDNKSGWAASAASITVDGSYIIEYGYEYMGHPFKKTYTVAIGDITRPVIELLDDSPNKDKFTKSYKIGDKFEFSTDQLRITGPENTDIFEYSGTRTENWLANPLNVSQESENFKISIMTPSGYLLRPTILLRKENGTMETIHEEDDNTHDYTVVVDDKDGVGHHSFKFIESGSYTISIRVKSLVKQETTKPISLTVVADEPKKGLTPPEIWGTILIILSVGLFLGVVVYFIRTGQQTKFASATKTGKTTKSARSKEKDDGDGAVV